MDKLKVIISTGQGRLHLIESARAIKNSGVDVKVITGWVPSKYIPDTIINILGRFVGRKNISYGLRKRKPDEIEFDKIKHCSFAEFSMHFLLILSKSKLINRERAIFLGWKLFGLQSKKYIKDADIFHVRTAAGNSGAIEKAKRKGMIVLSDQSTAHPLEIYNQLSKAYRGMKMPFDVHSGLWKMVLDDCKTSDYILTSCEYVKNSLIEYGFNSQLIYVIPLGVRQDFVNLKQHYSIHNAVKLLYTGSFQRWKGSNLIIEAVERLIEANIAFQIDIIGSVSEKYDIPAWFVNHVGVKMHGHVPQDDLKSFLTNSDIYIFPSYSDGGAQSQKEAMAAGLPVITSSKSGSPIVHGENGWIIPDDSSEALFDAIKILINSENLREKLGRNASVTISTEHTWENYGNEVAKLYTELLTKT
ncbi:MAG: glycosyltransferase family 4 protein [Paludibacter sp.]|nr:glycosyltransferase family 4 protein [Paludibacter sp.]